MRFRDFINHLTAKHQSSETVRLRLYFLRQLEKTHHNLYTVTAVDLDRFMVAHTHWMPETANSAISSFKSFYSWALLAKKMKSNPAEHLRRPRIDVQEARVTPDHVIEEALQKCTLQEAAMILLGRQGGLRRGEIAALRLDDRRDESLNVLGKGSRRRFVSIYGDLLDILVEIERNADDYSPYYFPGRYGGHVSGAHIYGIIMRLTGFSPHALRHAAGTAFYAATKDLRLTQEFLGHANSKTTERYAHVPRSALILATQQAGLRSVRPANYKDAA